MVTYIAWLGALVGAGVACIGLKRRNVVTTVMGVALFGNAMTLSVFAPLLSIHGVREPIPHSARIAGAYWAIAGGATMLGVLATVFRDQAPGRATSHRPVRWIVAIAAAAAASAVAIPACLQQAQQPSDDFLNAYGYLPGVLIYQLLFALWLGVPMATLAVALWRSNLGRLRLFTLSGCVVGVIWALWKSVGATLRYVTDVELAVQSPVSVTLGCFAVVLGIGGILLLALPAFREARAYDRRRRMQDLRLG